MPDGTTPAADSGDAGSAASDDWQGRYTGLQRVLSKRDEALATTSVELEQAKAALAAAEADAAEYRALKAAEAEEARQATEYESLRAKYEPELPTPFSPNASPGRARAGIPDASPTGLSRGWPTPPRS